MEMDKDKDSVNGFVLLGFDGFSVSVFELEKCNLAKNGSEFCRNFIGIGFRTVRTVK